MDWKSNFWNDCSSEVLLALLCSVGGIHQGVLLLFNVDVGTCEEIRWALESLGLQHTAEIKVVKPKFNSSGTYDFVPKHCTVFLTPPTEAAVPEYIRLLHGQIISGMSLEGDSKSCT